MTNKKLELKECMVLNYYTADSFDPITGVEFGKRTEKVVVLTIKEYKNEIELYNLTQGYKIKHKLDFMPLYFKAKIYEMTEELA